MRAWGITDVGFARQGRANQDAYDICEQSGGGVFVLCDGMGGANGGEIASSEACRAFLQQLGQLSGREDCRQLRQKASDAVDAANGAVWRRAQEDPRLEGMGTTVAAVLATDRGCACANVGDSRVYHITAAGIRQISTDHSLVAEMVRRGEISPLEAAHHPRRNYITRALGVERVVQADFAELEPKNGEYLLICSDGLYTEVSEPEIYYEVYHSGHPELACASLVHMANRRGGRDNITIILISF